jgi:hypothetical protein
MIVATPLDLPKIEPDSWDTFWKIWNTHAGHLTKIRKNLDFSKAQTGDNSIWLGLDIYAKPNTVVSWQAPYYDISAELPNMHSFIKSLPFKNLVRVRIIQSLKNIDAHADDNLDRWAIRNLFYCKDLNPQWYFTKPFDGNGDRKYLRLPESTTWFSYNDKFCWHGSDFNSTFPKFLMQIYAYDNFSEIVKSSVDKFKNYVIEI